MMTQTESSVPQYSLIGHKSLAGASHETVCCHGKLACNGRVIGTYENAGHGGPYDVRIPDARDRATFAAFVAAQPPVPTDFSDEPLTMTADLFIALLVDKEERAKFDAGEQRWLQKKCVGATLAREKGKYANRGEGWRVWKFPFSPEVRAKVVAWFAAKGVEAVEFANEIVPQTKAAQKVAETGVKKGARVRWTNGRVQMIGEVIRVNAKTLTIRDEQGGRAYRCGLGAKVEVLPALPPASRVKTVEEKAPVAQALLDAGWRGADEATGIDPSMVIARLAFKHEDAVGREAMGPLFAVSPTGAYHPLVLDKNGRTAKWFFLSEARKVASLLRVSVREE